MDKVMTFLQFDKMISATLIKWLFYISLVAVTFAGLFYMSNGRFFGGLLIIVFGVLFVRVYCEVMIILFKIHESLIEIKNK